MGFDCDALWMLAHDLFETLRDRLLDLFLLKLNEGPRRMKTLRPYRFLLRREFKWADHSRRSPWFAFHSLADESPRLFVRNRFEFRQYTL